MPDDPSPKTLNVRKVQGLTGPPEPNTMYLMPDVDVPYGLIIGVTSDAGDSFKRTPGIGDINEIIDVRLMNASKVTFDVKTGYMPNVGDTYQVDLDGLIRITYEKTTNSGYAGYKVNLTSISGDRLICFRRDTIYDNTSAEGTNMDSYLLTSTPYVSDSLVYGKMREFTKKVIVDLTTMVSWIIDVWCFTDSYVRFVIQRHQP